MEFVADKDQITTEEIVSHFGFNPITAKRYLRQLTEFGYLQAHGGNRNRMYSRSKEQGVRGKSNARQTFIVPQWGHTPFSCSAAPHWPQRKGVRAK